MIRRTLSIIIAAAAVQTAGAGVTQPSEFESADSSLDPLYAYFGGVLDWGASTSDETIHTGGSLAVWANLAQDGFGVAGFALGTSGITAPDLDVPAGADTFSLTVQPPAEGRLSVTVTLREDDNGDGLIDTGNDDQWESPTILLEPGTTAYNIPLSSFADADPDAGDNVQGFTTTGRLAYSLVFETRESYPGGRVTGPVAFLVDHVGLFAGPQELPAQANPADLDANGVVDIYDVIIVILAWGPCPASPAACPADINGDGLVSVDDLVAVIESWGG